MSVNPRNIKVKDYRILSEERALTHVLLDLEIHGESILVKLDSRSSSELLDTLLTIDDQPRKTN